MITKLPNGRYLAEFTIAVVAGRVVNEAASTVCKTRKAAETEIACWDRRNAENLADLANIRASRKAEVEAYLATRATRSNAQLSLF